MIEYANYDKSKWIMKAVFGKVEDRTSGKKKIYINQIKLVYKQKGKQLFPDMWTVHREYHRRKVNTLLLK
jgi:hypothetical protein